MALNQLTMVTACPVCGAEESLDNLLVRMIDDEQVRRLIASVISVSLPLGKEVIRYLRLHKPLKQRLRMDKLNKLLSELVPDLERHAIERNGRTWLVGPDAWRAAFEAVFEAADKGTLSLPLDGHGYLYTILMRMADRAEAGQERSEEAQRRQRVAQGVAMPIGAALDRVYGYRDPALLNMDEDSKKAVPMPPELREKMNAILQAGTGMNKGNV